MFRLLVLATALTITVDTAFPPSATVPTDTRPEITLPVLPITQIAARGLASVAEIRIYDKDGKAIAGGTAFAIAPELFITNLHVAAQPTGHNAKLKINKTLYDIAYVLTYDTTYDLCLLYAPNINLPSLPIAENYDPVIGEEVFTAGAPLGIGGIFSSGIISGTVQTAVDFVYAYTAAIAAGSSGSPLLNRYGQVIGVCFAGFDNANSLQFAIPATHLRDLLNKERKHWGFEQLPAPTDLMIYFPDFEE